MQRTNVYLNDRQLGLLRALSTMRGEPVAALVREAIDAWLESQSARKVPDDEWRRRLASLLARHERIAEELGLTEEQVERDVFEAIREVREARSARRR
jgi:hypothetical protein